MIISCQSEEYDLGDIIPPSNLTVSAQIIGANSENPFGDGSGKVNLSASADGAITYGFDINGNNYVRPSGELEIFFSNLGIHTYIIDVHAYGVAGTMISESISLEVEVTYEPPPELVKALTNGTWRVQAEESGYLGVGPLDSDSPIYYTAPPFTHSETALFDDEYIFSSDGIFNIYANGSIFGKAPPLSSDFTGDQGLTPNEFDEFAFYPIEDFTANWFITAPGDVLHLNFTGNGFVGIYVGGGLSYEIISWDANSIYVRTTGYDNNMWYTKITNLP